MKTRAVALAAVLVPVFLLAACGGNTPTKSAGHSAGATTSIAAPTSTSTPSTTSPTTPTGLPSGFAVQSVTFVSTQMGWVLGTNSCSPGCAPELLRSDDGGQSWTRLNVPGNSRILNVRFADASDGWMWASEGEPNGLWSTHDGGLQWQQVSLPIASDDQSISDVEASNGEAYAAVTAEPIRIMSSSVGSDTWTLSPTTLPTGAGPVPNEQIVLQGTSGWIVEVDRTTIAGARLSNGAWQTWTPPCAQAEGPVSLTASDPLHLTAYCDGGLWGGPSAVTLDTSVNGGSSFVDTPVNFSVTVGGPIASPTPGVVVLGDNQNSDLMATFNGGQSWTAVYSGPENSGFSYLGFTTPTQGVAIDGGTLLMTFDGGRQWSPVMDSASNQ